MTQGTASGRIAANARAIRARKKILIATIVRHSGFSERKVQRLLKGEQKWFAEDIEAVSAALGVDWTVLVTSNAEVSA